MANYVSSAASIAGGFGNDVIVALYPFTTSQMVAGGQGNDALLAGIGPVFTDIASSNSDRGTAMALDDASYWSIGPDAMIGKPEVPHTAVLVTGTDTQDWYAISAEAGRRVYIDVDLASSAFGAAAFDAVIQVTDAFGNLVAKNDDADASLGGAGSDSDRDPVLSFIAGTTGPYYINVLRYAMFDGVSAIPADAAYLLNVSVTDHQASADPRSATATLVGEDGDDLLVGTAGDDLLDGGAGNDHLIGGAGIDTASYADAAAGVTVSLLRTAAQDTGGAGVDRIEGVERLVGSAYADILTGDAGDNELIGGEGSDVLSGAAGNDRFTLSVGAALATETINGGSGTDTLILDPLYAWVVDLAAGSATNGGTTAATISGVEVLVASPFADRITAAAGSVVDAGAGDDLVFAAKANVQSIDGGAGVDTLDLSAFDVLGKAFTLDLATGASNVATQRFAGFENVVGGAYAETIAGTVDANALSGNAGDDTLSGLAGLDTLDGGDGDDVLDGGSDGDTLLGGIGDDRLSGGDLNDVLNGGIGDDVLDGGAGVDTVSYAGLGATGSTLAIRLDVSGPNNTYGAGTDTLIGIENVIGSAFSDYIIGDEGNNVLNGGGSTAGNFDFLEGRGGNDYLIGSALGDRLTGGTGNDTLNGGGGDDAATYAGALAGVHVSLAIAGAQDTQGEGVDTLVSIEGLVGSDHADVLLGNDLRNSFEGRDDDDTMIGAGGDDAFFVGNYHGHDTADGGDGQDAVYLLSSFAAWTVDVGAGTAISSVAGDRVDFSSIEFFQGSDLDDVFTTATSVRIYAGTGDDRIASSVMGNFDGADGYDLLDLSGWTAGGSITLVLDAINSSVFTARNIEHLVTGATTDTITGTDAGERISTGGGADTVNGLNGDDRISGGGGNDLLVGGEGNDRLDGGGGADYLAGGTLGDILTGGSGADRFALNQNDSIAERVDRITDFSHAERDRIDLAFVDANVTTTNRDTFTFVGRNAFSGRAGELRYGFQGKDTVVGADTDGDGDADVIVRLTGHIALVRGDFILDPPAPALAPTFHGFHDPLTVGMHLA